MKKQHKMTLNSNAVTDLGCKYLTVLWKFCIFLAFPHSWSDALSEAYLASWGWQLDLRCRVLSAIIYQPKQTHQAPRLPDCKRVRYCRHTCGLPEKTNAHHYLLSCNTNIYVYILWSSDSNDNGQRIMKYGCFTEKRLLQLILSTF